MSVPIEFEYRAQYENFFWTYPPTTLFSYFLNSWNTIEIPPPIKKS